MSRAEAIEKAARETIKCIRDLAGYEIGSMHPNDFAVRALEIALASPQSDHPVLTEAQWAFYEAALAEERVFDERDGDHEGPSMSWYGRHDAARGLRREKYLAIAAESGAEGGVVQ